MIEQYIIDLRHSDPTVRYAAAQKLGSSGDARALSPLIEALPDMNEKVQYAAFSGLLKLGDPTAAAPMLTVLIDDLDSRLWALMKLNIGMRLRHGLLDLLTRGDSALLAHVHGALALDALDAQQRAFFVRALGKVGTGDQVQALLRALLHEAQEVRTAAAESLGWIGDVSAYDALLELASSEREQLREVAIEALGRIGDVRAVDRAIEGLSDPSEWVRRASAVALGLLGDRRAIEPLTAAMHDEDEMVQDAAFESLKRFSTDRFTTII